MKRKPQVEFLTEKRQRRGGLTFQLLLQVLTAILLTAGMLGSIFSLAGFPVFLLPVGVSAAAVVVVLGLYFISDGKSYGALLAIAAAAVVFFFSYSAVIGGVYSWINSLQMGWNSAFGTFFEGFAVEGGADMLPAGLVVGLLLAALVSSLVCRCRVAVLTVPVFLLLSFNMLLMSNLPLWVGVVLFVGWLLAWASSLGGFDRRLLPEAVVVLVIVGLCIGGLSGTAWEHKGQRIRLAVDDGISHIRYGIDSLPEGNLRQAASMEKGDEPRLTVEMSRPGEIYLRGYVGARYVDDTWQPLDAEAFRGDFKGMLDWLRQRDFEPGAQYAGYLQADRAGTEQEANGGNPENAEEPENAEKISVSVRNQDADRKYIYQPETAVDIDGGGSWVQDWYLKGSGIFGSKRYEFTYYPTETPTELETPAAWLYRDGSEEQRQFAETEQVYRSFVHENYLELTDEERTLCERVFFNGDLNENESQLYTVTSRIRTVLRILTEHSSSPPLIAADRDFITWFLQEGHSGNSAYFATAAVLAYRAAGIPARYAEGYLLTEQDAAGAENAVILTGENAHAWVEVYVDGMGWRSVEVTPGFYTEPYKADVMIAVPNEAMEGSNGELAGMPSSENFQLPEQDRSRTRRSVNAWARNAGIILLVLMALLLLLEIWRAFRILIGIWRYERMSYNERFFRHYDSILRYMAVLTKDFDSAQPLNVIPELKKISGFDVDLYKRTVVRLERCIYGQVEPEYRDAAAAKALAYSLRDLLNARQPWWKKIIRRYSGKNW